MTAHRMTTALVLGCDIPAAAEVLIRRLPTSVDALAAVVDPDTVRFLDVVGRGLADLYNILGCYAVGIRHPIPQTFWNEATLANALRAADHPYRRGYRQPWDQLATAAVGGINLLYTLETTLGSDTIIHSTTLADARSLLSSLAVYGL